MSLRTSLAAVQGLGSAKQGVHHWWSQRVSALALVPLLLWLLWSFTHLPLADASSVAAWVADGWHPIWLTLLLLVVCWHSLLGMQVVIEDYVTRPFTKTAVLLLARFAHALLAVAGVYAVLRIALQIA